VLDNRLQRRAIRGTKEIKLRSGLNELHRGRDGQRAALFVEQDVGWKRQQVPAKA